MLKIIKAYILILFPLFSIGSNDSLKQKNYPVLDFYLHGGQIVKNYNSLPDANNTFISEFYFAKATDGNSAWHNHFLYPQIGVSLFLADFGNSKILGQGVSLMPSFIFKHGGISKFYGELKLGFGLGFFTKHYNVNDNPENLYIGSVTTMASFASYDITKSISSKIFFKAGISFFHFSNGHYQLPNIGMNIPCLNIGVKYLPHEMPVKFYSNRITDFDNRLTYNIRLGFGMHEFGYAAQSAGGTKYPVYTAAIYCAKRITPINNLQAGIFVNYYTSFYDYIISNNVFESDHNLRSAVATIFIGHEFMAGHFGFVAEAGVNIYNPFRKEYAVLTNQKSTVENFLKRWSGNKFGVLYYPINPEKESKNKFHLGVYLKTNFDQADFVEFGFGYAF